MIYLKINKNKDIENIINKIRETYKNKVIRIKIINMKIKMINMKTKIIIKKIIIKKKLLYL